ncbi:hypothetical protein [Acidovorax sp. MR-S7]|uniref:hypothetical protein n=1 Tax=Acidovorax sp. MR-S7 TaxID=1268622 RepID=UPI00037CE950|nr:hypothetical protein [Acidovorax sp. MR-S7]GAD22357.1 hypothetical protein AVS7_02117 [Acidovorax sp. MR-S7]
MSGPDWDVSDAAYIAQLQGLLARADTGAGRSRLALYTTTPPASMGDAHADTPQATLELAKPCGSLVGGALVLHVADPAGAMVMSQGMPRWAEWIAADGVLLTRCIVTDMDHGGGIRVIGGTTPEGETSPMLYPGGLVQLGLVALT